MVSTTSMPEGNSFIEVVDIPGKEGTGTILEDKDGVW